MPKRHAFTSRIEEILRNCFGADAENMLDASPLLGYLNYKTRAATRGSKARNAFGNHYAIYVLVEDYICKGYAPDGERHGAYQGYEGARYSDLMDRQRALPFGKKLQNHPLNARVNGEFKKLFSSVKEQPIVRDEKTSRYWIHEGLLFVNVRGADGTERRHNIARAIIQIIDAYVAARRDAFSKFFEACKKMGEIGEDDTDSVVTFICEQLEPNVDARIFEVVSFAVLKAYYFDQKIVWGWSRDELKDEALSLYKTGRTNANDGGIDFVMCPLGRFFQVTETTDVSKYLLDIDKVQHFPLTFVVKSEASTDTIRGEIRVSAEARYNIRAVVDRYMEAIEEIINIPILLERLKNVLGAQGSTAVMREIILQSKVEFNYDDLDADEEETSD